MRKICSSIGTSISPVSSFFVFALVAQFSRKPFVDHVYKFHGLRSGERMLQARWVSCMSATIFAHQGTFVDQPAWERDAKYADADAVKGR